MTLEEAIRHAEQVADSYKDTAPDCSCAVEHRQLAEWLTELQERREADAIDRPHKARVEIHIDKPRGFTLKSISDKQTKEADRSSATEIMSAYHEGVRKGIAEAYEAYRPQDICGYGEYCMCATCHYQEDCFYCKDCIEAQKQMHDIWTCTKYMRKEHLRKGACDAPTIVASGNCARCGKPIEGDSIFLCDECKSLMKGESDE